MCKGFDPLKLETSPEYVLRNEKTRKKYLQTWHQFCSDYNVSLGNPPKFYDYYHFFDSGFKNGSMAYSTARTKFTHLNKATEALYGVPLGRIYPTIYK